MQYKCRAYFICEVYSIVFKYIRCVDMILRTRHADFEDSVLRDDPRTVHHHAKAADQKNHNRPSLHVYIALRFLIQARFVTLFNLF